MCSGVWLAASVGAKILYWLTEWRTILKDPGFLLDSLTDGFVVLGGILGGILTAYIYCHIKKMDFLRYFDLLIPSVALAQGFGRLGCLLAGCCYGKKQLPIWRSLLLILILPLTMCPWFQRQIYASVLDFAHYFVLILAAKHLKGKGQVAGLYLILYSVGRFILEFYRGDLERGSVGILSTSQFISIFTFCAGLLLFLYGAVRKNTVDTQI